MSDLVGINIFSGNFQIFKNSRIPGFYNWGYDGEKQFALDLLPALHPGLFIP
jgi:hypothetical protein